MNVLPIKRSFLNLSGIIYDSDFINLANIINGRISFDKRTHFLTKEQKQELNQQPIKEFCDVIYVFEYNGKFGIVCDISIDEYRNGKLKRHELVLPDIIQGMTSNLHGYNCEAAPILLAHKERLDLRRVLQRGTYSFMMENNGLKIFAFQGSKCDPIIKMFGDVRRLYVADGHHRLYATSITSFKETVLACLVGFGYLDVLPMHRVIPNIDAYQFEAAKRFIESKFSLLPPEFPLTKGKIKVHYRSDSFIVELINLDGDFFWNNDVYRLNTQVISQAFRIFDTSKLDYIPGNELEQYTRNMDKNDVLIELSQPDLGEFLHFTNCDLIMPPKSTCFSPKFPSFLVFKQYR